MTYPTLSLPLNTPPAVRSHRRFDEPSDARHEAFGWRQEQVELRLRVDPRAASHEIVEVHQTGRRVQPRDDERRLTVLHDPARIHVLRAEAEVEAHGFAIRLAERLLVPAQNGVRAVGSRRIDGGRGEPQLV